MHSWDPLPSQRLSYLRNDTVTANIPIFFIAMPGHNGERYLTKANTSIPGCEPLDLEQIIADSAETNATSVIDCQATNDDDRPLELRSLVKGSAASEILTTSVWPTTRAYNLAVWTRDQVLRT